MASNAIPLSYQPPQRRRWLRRAGRIITLLAAAALTLWLANGDWYVRAKMQVNLLRAQRACMQFEAPADCVAVEADPKAARMLLQRQGGSAYRARIAFGFDLSKLPSRQPLLWTEMNQKLQAMCDATTPVERFNEIYGPSNRLADPAFSQSGGADFTIVFLHAMRTAAGDRLVDVEIVPDGGEWILRCVVWKPAGWTTAPVCLNPTPDTESNGHGAFSGVWPILGNRPKRRSSDLVINGKIDRFYVGQMDPSDTSRFTIRYHSPAGVGFIKGHLLPDNTVELTQDAAVKP